MSFFHVGTLKTTDYWSSQVHLLDNIDQALRDGITPDDPPEDVHEDGRDFGVAGNEIKGRSDSFGSCASTNIQKICWRATIELDYVHCCHGEASTID